MKHPYPALSFAFCLLLVCLVLVTPVKAQKKLQSKNKQTFQLKYGAFANIHSGVAFASFPKLQSALNQKTALSSDSQSFSLKPTGSLFGGSISILLSNHFIFSFQAVRTEYTTSVLLLKGSSQATDLSYGGLFGYAVMNRDRWLLYPYIGYKVGTTTLNLTNASPTSITFGDFAIVRNQTAKFTASVGTIDLGLASRYLIKQEGGVMLGAELGAYFSPSSGAWAEANGTKVGGAGGAQVLGGYLRVTLGGGIFEVVKKTAAKNSKKDFGAADKSYDPDALSKALGAKKAQSAETQKKTKQKKTKKSRRQQELDNVEQAPQ